MAMAHLGKGDTTLFPTDDEDLISFEYGAPGKALLPLKLWREAFEDWQQAQEPETFLQYGPCLGDLQFRKELSKFLTKRYRSDVKHESLCVTSGASQSFSNIIALFTVPGITQVIIENPTYFLAIRVLEDHGIKRESTVKIPVDENGLQLEALEKYLTGRQPPTLPPSVKGEKRFPYLLFLVPTFSNPSGVTLSAERREKLVALARKHDVLVVCDDVYQLLPFGSFQPPSRLFQYDQDTNFGNVISNQSFSKILAPGSRLGWIEAGPGIIDQYLKSGLMYSGGSANHFFSGVALSALRLGLLDRHLDNLRDVYASRMEPESVSFSKPKGGFFVWIELPKHVDTIELLKAIKTGGEYKGKTIPFQKISFAPGNAFSSDGSHAHCMRLTYSFYEAKDLLKGLQRLKCVLDLVL
ncbi:hypothetical protein HDU97_010123 [Phlyctochytrium planicorne]|nr:hypothetical protein HDU97_010123 [Phlyctochytrium planicorne]